MAITATDSGGGGDFTPAPAGLHQVTCISVIDLGSKYDARWDKWKHQIFINFEIPNEMIEVEIDGKMEQRPQTAGAFYTLSLGEKAYLRKDLESWLGRPLTPDELSTGYDLESLLNKRATIQIQHNMVGDKTYANITAVLPGMDENLKRINDLTSFALENPVDMDKFNKLSKGFQKMIMNSKEWAQLEKPDPNRDPSEPPPMTEGDIPIVDSLDDIPFD